MYLVNLTMCMLSVVPLLLQFPQSLKLATTLQNKITKHVELAFNYSLAAFKHSLFHLPLPPTTWNTPKLPQTVLAGTLTQFIRSMVPETINTTTLIDWQIVLAPVTRPGKSQHAMGVRAHSVQYYNTTPCFINYLFYIYFIFLAYIM